MHPLTPNADLLRSIWVSEFISDLIHDMRDGPKTLLFLLSQHPENYDAITKAVSVYDEDFVTFSPHTIGGLHFGLWILGFDVDSPTPISGLFAALSTAPFDEGGIYIQGRHHLRLLPNEELKRSA